VLAVWRAASGGRDQELQQWRQTMGLAGKDSSLRLTRSWDKTKKAPSSSGPKHGKAPDGKRHAGGNTWAGGTGGTDTAGMGGKGGPYRLDLDDGHPVMQISDEEKANVSAEAHEAARLMGKEALAKRLEEIGMSDFEDALYRRFYDPVANEIAQLRVVLQGVEARAQEREFLKMQPHGELDDARLVDGAAGDKNIYRRRGEKAPDPGAPQMRPKRLRFVLDVSGSMYRFNSEDRRLERCCQMAVMLMEALAPFSHKYSWSLVGHSGDGPVIKFVDYDKPPSDAAERLLVIQQMWAHSQYCMSGDCTLEATEDAIKDVMEVEADDRFVFLLSDANLRRYGIMPEELSAVLTMDKRVNAFALFLAGGKEAEKLARALPFGRGFVCSDTSRLPGALKDMFTAVSMERSLE